MVGTLCHAAEVARCSDTGRLTVSREVALCDRRACRRRLIWSRTIAVEYRIGMSDEHPPTSPAALLALIAGDHQALQILAAYAAQELRIADLQDDYCLRRIAAITDVPPARIPVCLHKLVMARVLRDGGITELADRLLQSHVQANLAPRRSRK
jgi:hypothetical protein